MLIDCNQHSLEGDFAKKSIAGVWSYSYYELKKVRNSETTTLIGCAETSNKFITVGLGDLAMVRYNSRLLIVVYVPKEIEVKYRLWSARQELESAVIK